jgi:hypothetical protein
MLADFNALYEIPVENKNGRLGTSSKTRWALRLFALLSPAHGFTGPDRAGLS